MLNKVEQVTIFKVIIIEILNYYSYSNLIYFCLKNITLKSVRKDTETIKYLKDYLELQNRSKICQFVTLQYFNFIY